MFILAGEIQKRTSVRVDDDFIVLYGAMLCRIVSYR